MADLALLVGNTDTALPSEGAATSVVADNTDTGRAGGFSQLLGEHVQMTRREPTSTVDSSLQTGQANGQMVAEAGEADPLDGKPLPQSLLQSELQSALQAERLSMPGEAARDDLDAGSPVNLTTLSPTSLSQLTPGEMGAKILPATGQVPGQSVSTLSEPFSNPLANNTGAARLPHETANLQAQLSHKVERQNALPTGKPVEALNLSVENMGRGDKQSNPAMSDSLRSSVAPVGQLVSANARLAMARAGLPEARMNTKSAAGVRASQGLSIAEGWSLQTAAGLRNAVLNASVSGQMPIPKPMTAKVDNILSSIATNPSNLVVEETNSYGLLAGVQRLGVAPSTGASPMLNVATTVGQPGWANEIGQRVTWLANSELREAQLQLHPKRLGPIEVRIVYGQEQQLNVSFTATNPATREALDAAMPRLREMFEQQGLNLTNSDVSHESFAEQRHRNQADTEAESAATSSMTQTGDDIDTAELLAPPPTAMVAEGMIDAYA